MDFEETVHPIPYYKKDGSFSIFSTYVKHDDPNQVALSSKLWIRWDKPGSVASSWPGGPLAVTGAEGTLLSCTRAVLGRKKGCAAWSPKR